jgi:hypothetical protein
LLAPEWTSPLIARWTSSSSLSDEFKTRDNVRSSQRVRKSYFAPDNLSFYGADTHPARMAKLADAADLKSADLYRSWGFKSPSGHQINSHKINDLDDCIASGV